MSAILKTASPGQLKLIGTLDFDSVPQLWPDLLERLKPGEPLDLSLAGVEQANSAALALLLETRQVARARGVELRITDLPNALNELARLSNAVGLLNP